MRVLLLQYTGQRSAVLDEPAVIGLVAGSECVARGITRGRVSRDQNRVWYGMVYFEDIGTSSENGRIKVGCYDSKTG